MNILELLKTKKISSIIAKIIERPSDTKYVVQDSKNRKYIAEANSSYRIGETVIIKNGIIISKVKSLNTYKEYVV